MKLDIVPKTHRPPILVSMCLDGDLAHALDAACAVVLTSRAGLVRRYVADALRNEGFLPALPTGPRPIARTRPNEDR